MKRLIELTGRNIGDAFFKSMVRSLAEALQVDHVFVAYALDEPATRVRVQASWCRNEFRDSWDYDIDGQPCRIPYDGEPTLIPCDVNRDFEKKRKFPYKSFIGIPLKTETGKVYGHLAVYADRKIDPDGPELEIARLFAHRAEAEAERKILEEKLQDAVGSLNVANRRLYEESRTDPLTRLANRLAFTEFCQREFRRARRGGTDMSLLYLDLDLFKGINDTYGHEAGDEVLRHAAAAMSGAIREDVDIAGRMGGEEFAVLLPDADAATALRAGRRLAKAVQDAAFDFAGERLEFTCSVGVAKNHTTDTAWHEILNRADEALYAAKRGGRNRVVSSESDVDEVCEVGSLRRVAQENLGFHAPAE